MSTRTTTTPVAQTTDAEFRAWAQWIHDGLAAFGWVNTTDTGQINLATVLTPSAANQSRGYEIWRMADALQGSNPVFLKLEYGSGSAASNPGVWITLGTAANGSGTLTGQVTTRQQVSSNAGETTARNSYASGNTDRCVFAMMADSTATQTNGFMFGIERTKDAAGANNTEGAHFFILGGAALTYASYLMTFSGALPPADTLFASPLENGTTGSFGADVYLYPIFPNGYYPRNPIMNAIAYFSADFTRETSITVDFYGGNHTFLPIANPTHPSSGQRQTALDRIGLSQFTRLAIRYE